MTAAELAGLVGGTLVGDGAVELTGAASLDKAGPGDVSFLVMGRYLAEFRASRAGAVLCTAEHRAEQPGPGTRILVRDPQRAMLVALRALFPAPPRPTGIDHTARLGPGVVLGRDVFVAAHVVIGKGARIGDRVTLMAGAVIGEGVWIGDDTILYPNVVCYSGTSIGSRVMLHAGVRLGVDGFGYVPGEAGHEKIPHVGRCIVGDDVEIGANSTVDRGSIDDTVIGAGTKLDNLVHIGHNCRIGERCLIMGQVGLAGSTRVEDEAVLAGQAGLAGHLTVGRRARVAAQSGVIGDVPAGATFGGYPARPHQEWMRATSTAYRLAGLVRELEELVGRGGPKHG